MKQVYKKKPEYLAVVYVGDDTQSIKDVYDVVGSTSINISFDENGERVINLDGDVKVTVGMVLFKDKKTDKLVCMPQEKLLQVYDLYEEQPKKD